MTPLAGVRVIDLAVILAGPAASMLLADWGAEVIRLESFTHYQEHTRGPRHPDPAFVARMNSSRHPHYAYPDGDPGERPWNRFATFNSHGRNKLSVELDIATEEGRAGVLALAATADLVIENNAPRLLDRLGLTYQALRAVNPRLSLVRMPAFGLSGPYRDYKANGLNMDAISGQLATRGYPDADADAAGSVVTADAVASICGALGASLALAQRERTGRGQLVEAAMLEAFLGCLPAGVLESALTGAVPGRRGNRSGRFAPQGVYPCRGVDRWVTIVVRADDEWRLLGERLGWSDWLSYDLAARRASADEIDARIAEWTRSRDRSEVVAALGDRLAVAPVTDEADVFADPHLAARHVFGPLTQRDSGTHLYQRAWWTVNGQRPELRLPPPALGEHTLGDLLGEGGAG